MTTGINISFGLIDVTAKQETVASATDKQPFNDVQDLSLEGVYAPPAATMEKDYWRLDGTYTMFPDNPEDVTWGYWSKSMTEDDGKFAVPPVLTLAFAGNHSSIALSLEFNPYGNDYCNDMNIKWYYNQTLLADRDFTPDRWRFSCNEKVENYNRIVLTFRGMNRPCRYLKLQNIMHGVVKVFEDNEIYSADLLEEIDLTSSELSINTFQFKVYSEDDDFNILNPKGAYNLLQKKQQIFVEGNKNGAVKNLGTFYVDEWESQNSNIFQIKTVDGIGIMDGTTFRGGIYSNKPAQDLISEIMDDAGFGYSLDSTFKNVLLSGWLPVSSHREALQQAAFALGAYVDTSRSGTINIRRQPDASAQNPVTIGMDRKFAGTTVKLRDYVTGVTVVEHNYMPETESNEIFKGSLEAGDNEVLFSSPASNLTVSGGTIKESGANYAVVTVAAAGQVVINGKRYVDNTKLVTRKMESLPAGEKENIYEVSGATLVSAGNAAAVADRLFAYYQKRIEQNISFVLADEATGDISNIETSAGIYRGGVIEKLSTNLTGGFTTKAVVIGD